MLNYFGSPLYGIQINTIQEIQKPLLTTQGISDNLEEIHLMKKHNFFKKNLKLHFDFYLIHPKGLNRAWNNPQE